MAADQDWDDDDERKKKSARNDDDDEKDEKPKKKPASPLANIFGGIGLVVLGVGGTIATVAMADRIFFILPIAAIIGIFMFFKGLIGLLTQKT